MAGLPQFLISTQTDPYWEIPLYDKDGNPLSVEGRVFEAWIAPAETKAGVAQPPAEIKVLTFQDGLSLLPPTDGSGDQTKKNTFVHQVSRAFAQANFPRGELTADLLEVVDGARRMFAPVRLFYGDPAQIRDFIAERQGITFGQGRQAIVTPVAIAGQAGRRGSGLLTGTLPPQPSDGEDGDYWVVEREGQANVIYGPKEGGEWPAQPSSTFGVGGVADVPGLPEVIEGTVKRDANLGDLTDKDQARETILAARKTFRQVGSDIDTDLASAARQTLTPTQYTAGINNGAARAEATILRAFREGRAVGRRLDLQAGTYLTSGLEFDWRGLAGDFTVDRRGVPIRGEGSQNTIIKSAVADQFAISHIGPALVPSGMSDLSIVGAVPDANGIDLFGIGYFNLSGINLGNLKTAIRAESVLSSTFDKIMITDVETGVDIQSPIKPGAFTDFNMVRWNNAHFKQCRKWAMNGGPSSTIPMWAPVIEGNGTMSRGSFGEAIYDPANDTGALKLTFTGGNGHVGLVMLAAYIEANLGKCDIELINTSDRPVVHVLIGPYFGRLDGGSYTQHNLILTGKHVVIIIGGVHEHHHNYVPNADRSYIKYNKAESKVVNIGTTWESDLEKGDLFNIEDVLEEVRARPRVQSFSGNSGPTSIPGGVTRYLAPGLSGVNAFEVYAPVGRRVRIRNLKVYTLDVPGAGESYTVTVQKLFTPTAITCTISGAGSNTASDDVNSAIFEPGDRLCLKFTSSAGANAASNVGFSLVLETLDATSS